MSREFKIGFTTSSYRPIKSGTEYDKLFPKPNEQDRIIIEDGNVYQTVDLMQKVVWKYLDDTKRIAKVLKANTIQQTAKNIWDFLYHHIQYKLDKKGLEELRRPARSWHERRTGIDCDCFSIFASSILTNLKIPHKLRITKYDADVFQHVYVIIPNNGSILIIDPVLHEFNYQKPYTEKRDYTMNLDGINIAVLSGPTGNDLYDTILSTELEGTGLGDPNKESEALFRYLVKTRNALIQHPEMFSFFEDVDGFTKYLDYAIKHWHTPNRDQALAILADKENEFNELHGFQGYEDMDTELLGFILKKKQPTKVPQKKFFTNLKKVAKNVKQGAKKVAKPIIRYNPATIAARNGFLVAMKLNLKKMASKLIWAYVSKDEALKHGISESKWNNAKKALVKVERLFADKLQGKRDALKNAIMKGKAGKKADIGGLGEPVTATTAAALITAATPIIVATIKILKDAGLIDKNTNENVNIDETEVKKLSTQQPTDPSSAIDDYSDVDTYDVENGEPAKATTDNPTVNFLKKNPMVVVGGIAALGGIGYLLLSGDKSKKKQKALSGAQNRTASNKKKPQPDKVEAIKLN
jgi:hypothetical protein